jgi:hypothetical protein
VVVVDTTTFTEGIIDYDGEIEAIPDGGDDLGEVRRGDRAWARGIFPVRDASGRKVGGLFVLHDFTAAHAALRAALLQAFLVLVALEVLAAAAIIALVRWLVFARLERLRRAADERASVEALPPSRYIELESEDEIGRLEGLLRRVLFPSRARQAPEGAAPQGASSDRR